jgi:hypothetical protein
MDTPELPNDIIDLILTFSGLDVAVHCRNTFVVQEKTLADVVAFHRFFRSAVSLHDSSTLSYLCGLATFGLIPCDFDMLLHFVYTAHIGCLPMFKLLHRRLECVLSKRWYERALCHAAHEGHVCVVKYILDSDVIPCHEQPECLAWYFAEKARPWFTDAPSQTVLAYLSTKMPPETCTGGHMYVCLPYVFTEAICYQSPCRCCIT